MPIQIIAYCTQRHAEWPDFNHRSVSRQDLTTPGFDDHLINLVRKIFERADGRISHSVYGICRHLQRTTVILAMEVEADQFESLAPWAWQSNAIFFLPDGSIRDPNGAVLVDHETMEPDGNAQLPYPVDARNRKAQSELALRNRQIDTPETLPPVVGQDEVHLRTPDEIAWRMLALFVVAVRAESLASDKPIPIESIRAKQPMAFQALTPWEENFLASDDPGESDVSAAGWRYEALAALQWTLGMTPELPFPDEICDVPEVAKRMIAIPARELITNAKIRPTDQILDMLDLNYRLLWGARQATANNVPPPQGIDGGVIAERQHALNWVTCFENADWDDVDIPS